MNTISNDLNILISSIQNIENKTKESFSNSSNIIENIPAKFDYISFYSQDFIYEELLETLNQIDTSKVTNMGHMFYQCYNLNTIPNFDTSNVTNMSYMFMNCTNLNTIPNFDTSNVRYMYSMFYNCSNLINIPNFNTSNVTSMTSMFSNCYNLINIPNFNTSNVTNMYSMFSGCSNLITIPELNTSNVTFMSNMFSFCTNLINIPNLDTSNVTSMSYMFEQCYNLINIPELNTSNVRYMYNMFSDCNNLTIIPNFDTSKVINMYSMFSGCSNLITIPELNTSRAIDMNDMFAQCHNLSYSSLKNILNMRYLASNFKNMNLMNIGLSDYQLYYYLTPNDINDYVSKGYIGGKSKTTNLPIVNTSKISTSGLELSYIYNINTATRANIFINEVMNLPHMSPSGDLNANQYELIKFLPKYTNMNVDRNIDINNSSFEDSYGAIYLDVEGGMGGKIYYALHFTAINIDDPNCNNYENWDAYSNAHFSHTFAQASIWSSNRTIEGYWVDMNVNIPDWVGRIGYINSDFKNSNIGRNLVLNWYNVN